MNHYCAQPPLLVLHGIRSVAVGQVAGTVYGGENRDKEKARLRKGINILVATPG